MTDLLEQTETRSSVVGKRDPTGLRWVVAAIVILGLGLRVWGIDFGLPYELTNDESKEILRALKLGAGEYYWGFGKGGLYYILFVEYAVLYVFWWITGRVADATDFAVQFILDPTMFFLLGRLTVAIMGTLTCLVVFHIGKRTYDWRAGLGAALIGATAYAHAVQSHLVSVDVGMALAMWASILAYTEYEKSANRRWLVAAGMLAGLAIAFKLPGAVVLPALFLALGSRSGNWRDPGLMFKDAGIVTLATLATLTIVAPEWIIDLRSNLQPYFWILQGNVPSTSAVGPNNMEEAFRSVTTYRDGFRMEYLKTLMQGHNFFLMLSALAGGVFGLLRRERWSMIWGALVVLFIGVMSAASRGQPEHYLLPIMPCLWLLASRAIVGAAGHYRWLVAAGFASVAALSLFALIRQNVEWTQPDTRIVAKEWIESNIPPGAKILMDGYQHRFTPSPPLLPDKSAVFRQISGVTNEPNRFRGVSERSLKIYAQAMDSVTGPRYELHSTVWGLAVEEPSTYVQRCFDYIITSSLIANRYERDRVEKRLPEIARFYSQLDSVPFLRKVHTVEPISWKRSGPVIKVYQVLSTCTATQKSNGDLSQQ